MTDEELKELVASLVVAQKQTDRQLKQTDRQLKELGQQIGGLGNKFGSFTEGMAFPSMTHVLRKRFHMETIATRVQNQKNGESMELDVLAYANAEGKAVYVVEVKSHLKEEGLEQMLATLKRFPAFFPEHRDKQLFGILAAVDTTDALRQRVLQEGIYLALIQDNLFQIDVPDGFQPRSFNEERL